MESNADRKVLLNFAMHAILTTALLWGLHYAPSGIAPLVDLLDPVRGLYHNARMAEHASQEEVAIPTLSGPVNVERDERGVPHIFAEEDRDAILALGYVTAQDRLFQMDFISRVAAGRLSEIFGPASLGADRYLRSIGMNGAAKQIMAAFAKEGGLDYEIMTWYADGVNAYLSGLSYAEWPLEFKLFDYAPEPYTPMHTVLLMQYFNYDLSFNSEEAAYGLARERLGADEYAKLYPRHATRYKPGAGALRGAARPDPGRPEQRPGGRRRAAEHLPGDPAQRAQPVPGGLRPAEAGDHPRPAGHDERAGPVTRAAQQPVRGRAGGRVGPAAGRGRGGLGGRAHRAHVRQGARAPGVGGRARPRRGLPDRGGDRAGRRPVAAALRRRGLAGRRAQPVQPERVHLHPVGDCPCLSIHASTPEPARSRRAARCCGRPPPASAGSP